MRIPVSGYKSLGSMHLLATLVVMKKYILFLIFDSLVILTFKNKMKMTKLIQMFSFFFLGK